MQIYDYIFITHVPAFYKVNLYNEIAKSLKIHVLFIGESTSDTRSNDFSGVGNINFEYTVLSDKQFQLRSKLKSCVNIIYFLFKNKYKKLLYQDGIYQNFGCQLCFPEGERVALL